MDSIGLPPPDYEESPAPAATTSQFTLDVPPVVASASSGASVQDIMLTWDAGDEIHGAEPAVRALTAANAEPPLSDLGPLASPLLSPPRSPSTIEFPPEYARAQRPTTTVKYTFSPIGPNAMVLVPSADALDSRPRYYITVSMNCFMPSSHITTIHRGANEHGSTVAEFEMGMVDASSRVQMGSHAVRPIFQVLSKYGSRIDATWTWTCNKRRGQAAPLSIRWNYSRRPCICTMGTQMKILAKFTPHMGPTLKNTQSTLEVTPEGHDLFNDVLTSLLIIERKRLTPTKEAVLKGLFN